MGEKMSGECRNCGVLKIVGHENEKEKEKCQKAIGRKYGYFMPDIPMKSLWMFR